MRNTNTIPKNIDEYLENVPEPARTTLQQVRLIIRSVVPPEATEVITYHIPAFHYKGALVGFAAFAKHCSFFPMNGSVVAKFAADLKNYTTSKGTIQFPSDQPLPAALIKKIVKVRLAENSDKRFLPKPPKPALAAKPQAPVAAFMGTLDHPLKRDIQTVRKAILAADPSIAEDIKWNAPSFRTVDFFATINLRSRDRVEVILHTGAKKKQSKPTAIPDPAGIIKWLAPDRCAVHVGRGKNLKLAPLTAIIQAWLPQVTP